MDRYSAKSKLAGRSHYELRVIAQKTSVSTSFSVSGKPKWLRKETIVERLIQYAEQHNKWSNLEQAIESTIGNVQTMTSSEAANEMKATIEELINKAVAEAFGNQMGSEVMAAVEKTTQDLIAKHRPIEVRYPTGSAKRVKGKMPKEFDRIVELASQRVHVYLVGPAGCGKTYVAEKVAEALGLSFSHISCSVGMSESQLAGWLLPTGKAGAFEYHASPFVKAYEEGGLFLLDEMDSADANTMTFINAALANGHMSIPQRLHAPTVKRHKDFVCIAAANTYGLGADMLYVGRNQLDAATLDRFRAGMIVMDYDPEVEQSLIDADVLAWGRHIRAQIKQHGLQRIMSMRTLINLTKMTEAYKWPQEKWEESYFADWPRDERSRIQPFVKVQA